MTVSYDSEMVSDIKLELYDSGAMMFMRRSAAGLQPTSILTDTTAATGGSMGICKLCTHPLEIAHPKRTFVTASDQRGATCHTDCLQQVSWTPEVQFSPSIHVDGLRDVLTQHHARTGEAPLLVWSGLRVRVTDPSRRDHRCVWCKGACGDDSDLDTLCVLDSHVQPHAQWHATQWIHRTCIEPALAARRLVRIARNYHCFSGLRLKS